MLFKSNKIILILATIILSANIFAGGIVTFTPSLIPCGALGCGPLTITNATRKTIAFAGVAVSYQDPKTPLTNFLYLYTGCTDGIIATGASCDVVINPNGFTLVPGNYAVRPLFYRTLEGNLKELFSISFDVQTGVDCTDDTQCAPDNCTAGACVAAVSCFDSIQNQDETDVDCGGLTCAARCGEDEGCDSDDDCDQAGEPTLFCNINTCAVSG